MAILSNQFSKALESVEPSPDDKANAPKAHQEVRASLTSADDLESWGVNPVLIGSYKRDVSIRRVKDVDVFCRMDDIGTEVAASTVLDTFYAVLDSSFGVDSDGNKRVKRQARSITIEFPEFDGLHVDAVPARKRTDGYWEIPTRDGQWQMTNPEELTTLKTAMNETYDGDYVRLVKLVRQTRRTILDKRPGGLFVELALYDACVNSRVSKDGLTIGYVTALESIADYLGDKVAWGRSLPDPTMPGQTLTFRATDKQWEAARDRFRSAATKAREAYTQTDAGKAAVAFRELLGKNGDGDIVFPMPPGYNEDGTKRESAALITPGTRNVPAGDRRFG
ncbi:nucleotidyltransferase [Kribbella sp. NPDC048928]|uniref:SMODS domain-containing nucleotidyltransferase n=1 Tax=Kribbella sp. NPDC048928 TaxID=3364111 RepID=UPI00371C412C